MSEASWFAAASTRRASITLSQIAIAIASRMPRMARWSSVQNTNQRNFGFYTKLPTEGGAYELKVIGRVSTETGNNY